MLSSLSSHRQEAALGCIQHLSDFLPQGLGCVFLGICGELAWHDWKQITLKAGHGWKQSTLKASTWALAPVMLLIDAYQCNPPLFLKKAFSHGRQGSRLGSCCFAEVSKGASLLLSPRKRKVAVGNGDWGCIPQSRSHQPWHCYVALREEEEEEKQREMVVKLLKAARERREERGWSPEIFFVF